MREETLQDLIARWRELAAGIEAEHGKGKFTPLIGAFRRCANDLEPVANRVNSQLERRAQEIADDYLAALVGQDAIVDRRAAESKTERRWWRFW